jgi:hypothetical protein
MNLKESLDACKKISSNISIFDLYNKILTMLGDTAKLLYGYEDFIPQRKSYLLRLRDIHGYSILEFLDYLLKRDKYVDRIGLQNDIILLHYKFCMNKFNPPEVKTQKIPVTQNIQTTIVTNQPDTVTDSTADYTYTQLSQMSIKEQGIILRNKRQNNKVAKEKEEPQTVPLTWPMPKEEKLGENSYDDDILSPQEFSKNLVGGRGNYVE